MKKLITNLFFSFAIIASFQANAQYCGSSQVSFPSCGFQTTYGFGDVNTYSCVTRGQNDSLIIPFKIYANFTAQGNTVRIYKLKILSIDSLPCGMCWSTNTSADSTNQANEFDPNESGCIRIFGNTSDLAGAYKLSIMLAVRTQPIVTAADDTTYNIPSIASDAGGIALWVKLMNPGGTCPDTIIASQPSMHPSATCQIHAGIAEIGKSLSNLTIQPNPMSNEAKVSFTSENGGTQQVRITNIVGSEVFNTTINAKQGLNDMTINRNNFPAGIYILTIGNNQGTASRKFVIAE